MKEYTNYNRTYDISQINIIKNSKIYTMPRKTSLKNLVDMGYQRSPSRTKEARFREDKNKGYIKLI